MHNFWQYLRISLRVCLVHIVRSRVLALIISPCSLEWSCAFFNLLLLKEEDWEHKESDRLLSTTSWSTMLPWFSALTLEFNLSDRFKSRSTFEAYFFKVFSSISFVVNLLLGMSSCALGCGWVDRCRSTWLILICVDEDSLPPNEKNLCFGSWTLLVDGSLKLEEESTWNILWIQLMLLLVPWVNLLPQNSAPDSSKELLFMKGPCTMFS